MKCNITFMISTLNEDKNLPYALESCSFAEQVFVLDSGSIDKTKAIAEKFCAVFVYHPWEGYARQKNWGLDNLPIKSDWVFILDADEVVSPQLREEIISISTKKITTDKTGFYVNRYFVWNGQEIRHCGYYPSWNLRFFLRDKARYEEREVHEHMVVDGPVGYLKGEMRHEDRRGREFLWQKHLKYAELEAHELIRAREGYSAGLKPSFFGNSLERRRAIKERVWPYLPARWLLRFIYMYLIKKGFLDGKAGIDMSLFMTRYELEISRRFRVLKNASQ